MQRLPTRMDRTDGRNSYSVIVDYADEKPAVCALATCGRAIEPKSRRPYDRKTDREWCSLLCWLRDNQIGEPKP